jgi:hypothetical protein
MSKATAANFFDHATVAVAGAQLAEPDWESGWCFGRRHMTAVPSLGAWQSGPTHGKIAPCCRGCSARPSISDDQHGPGATCRPIPAANGGVLDVRNVH